MTSNNNTELKPADACEGGGKHHWMHSLFCDRCDMDFDVWYSKVNEHIHKETSVFLLAVLEAVLNEQVKAKLITHDSAKYVFDAVRDQAYKQGWIEQNVLY